MDSVLLGAGAGTASRGWRDAGDSRHARFRSRLFACLLGFAEGRSLEAQAEFAGVLRRGEGRLRTSGEGEVKVSSCVMT